MEKRPCHLQVFFFEGHKGVKPQSAGKIITNALWDSERMSHVDFRHGVTVNGHYYGSLLCSDVHQGIWKKGAGKL
jgi:hypothetical protein